MKARQPVQLSYIILDIVAIIAILSLVLLGDLLEQRTAVEVDTTGKSVRCTYGYCYFVDATVINQQPLLGQYEDQGRTGVGS